MIGAADDASTRAKGNIHVSSEKVTDGVGG